MDFDDDVILTNHADIFNAPSPRLWVFGYGSLLWKVGFDYDSAKIGYVQNYERRFNQGNATFRGTKENPGRVANLEEKIGAKVWGVAYEIRGKEQVLSVLRNLYVREIACGGYDVMMTQFYARKDSQSCPPLPSHLQCLGDVRKHDDDDDDHCDIQVLLFTPTRENSLYLGQDSIREMAGQIVERSGCAGSNAEYVLNISDFISEYIPEDDDPFLSELASEIRKLQPKMDTFASKEIKTVTYSFPTG